ncbi:hypothetical protein [Antarcticimicrobium sediminis]|uniref:Uncharacterized protein n=1 Tax=Antarcticimicrobium sediminis TaxID=2546227 RepID=A0A4V2Z8G4_9RHOB|nr:hypothetical protein [Antarcticimicrobium sediminis]TDE40276.1 hypothetical protein E1B25_04815 [Antarcticimicrobium sediminis]
MKKIIALLSLMASPALAHSGHATLPGPAGHAEMHIAMAAAAIAVAWLVFAAVVRRKSTRNKE